MKKDILQHIPVDQLNRGKYQPRADFNVHSLQELADSIRAQGVVEPIIVRPVADNFEIIAGERRWRAAQLAGLTEIPCIIRYYSDKQAAAVTLIENIQREDLNPIEEARALQRLLEEFNYTHDEVAKSVGKSRAKITNSLRLLNLAPQVQQWIIEKKLSEGHGKALAVMPEQMQLQLAKECIDQEWSVRKMENEVKNAQLPITSNEPNSDPNISRLERVVSERFGAEVKLENSSNRKSGWLKIKYYDYDILSGILEKMGIDHDRL